MINLGKPQKKLFFFVAQPLREGAGDKGLSTKKKTFFEALKKS